MPSFVTTFTTFGEGTPTALVIAVVVLTIILFAVVLVAKKLGMNDLDRLAKYIFEFLTLVAMVCSGMQIYTLQNVAFTAQNTTSIANKAQDSTNVANPAQTTESDANAANAAQNSKYEANLEFIGLITVIALGVAILVILEGLSESWPTALMWGTACFACGAVLGLIFGIPPYVETNPTTNSTTSTNSATRNSSANGSLSAAKADLDQANKGVETAQKNADDAVAAQKAGPKDSNGTQKDLDDNATKAKQDLETLKGKQADAQKKVESLTPSADHNSAYGVNTNLTDISDWLTKIIVGVGLVQLGKIRGQLKDAANFVARGLVGSSSKDVSTFAPMALGIILYFVTLGFLSSYLLTRVWLPLLLNARG